MFLFFCLQALAREPDSNSGDDFSFDSAATESEQNTIPSTPKSPPLTEIVVVLHNGVVLKGQAELTALLTWSPGSELTFTPEGGEQITLKGELVASVQNADAQIAPAQLQPQPAPSTAQSTQEAETEELQPVSPGGFAYLNPAATRYLYAPSAIPMQAGQGYVSQKLLFTTGVYAPTDNVTLLIGTFSPFPPLMTVAGAKVGFKVADKWHVSAGGEVFFLGFTSEVPLGLAFGAVTYGDTDKHITVASGYAYEDVGFTQSGAIPLMIAGHQRFTERTALITENWMLFDPAPLQNANTFVAGISSIAFRVIGKRDRSSRKRGALVTKSGYPRSTWDFGLVAVFYPERQSLSDPITGEQVFSEFQDVGGFGPMPWIDYTWHFGPARK